MKLLSLLAFTAALPCFAQLIPPSPNTQWQSPDRSRYESGLRPTSEKEQVVEPGKSYTLAELIDAAERHNPDTRVSWERARQAAAQLGIARSALYPLLAAQIATQQLRHRVLFGNQYFRQDLTNTEPALSLLYTVFDGGSRQAQIDAARANTFAAGMAFNQTHQRIIFAVTSGYYRLIAARGQVDAAQAALSNARTVQDAVEQRLKNGLATLPDSLQARAETAQALYELETARGSERVARGLLAEALGISPTVSYEIQEPAASAIPAAVEETVEDAIHRALSQRPDLLAQAARIHAAAAEVRNTRSEFYPKVTLNADAGYFGSRGVQQDETPGQTFGSTWLAQLSFRWNIFDGRERENRLQRAESQRRETESEMAALRDRAEVEVWNAYSTLQTALEEQKAAASLLEASENSYSAALEAYNYGVRNFLDVASAQRSLAQARTSQVRARAQVMTSVAELAFRTGALAGGGRVPTKP